jgi:hypothetical protein
MSDPLPTDLLVSATRRRAATEGVSIVAVRKGDATSGSLALKVNLLNGTARAFAQARAGDELVWSLLGTADPMPENEADAVLNQQADFDPDVWIVEIEDKKGRIWFPGRIAASF